MREITVGGRKIEVEEAQGMLSQAIGLRGRTRGRMMFRFPFERRWRIDNVLVRTDLCLYFFDSNKELVESASMPPGVNPLRWRVVRPEKPAKYLLESSEPLELDEGDRIELPD